MYVLLLDGKFFLGLYPDKISGEKTQSRNSHLGKITLGEVEYYDPHKKQQYDFLLASGTGCPVITTDVTEARYVGKIIN